MAGEVVIVGMEGSRGKNGYGSFKDIKDEMGL